MPQENHAPRAPRVAFTIAVQHRETASNEVDVGEAQDISTTGLFLASESPCEVGTVLDLDISAPDDGPFVSARGRVVRRSTLPDGRRGLGIVFLDLDDASRQVVELIVAAGVAHGVAK